jgi:hypothetical protein
LAIDRPPVPDPDHENDESFVAQLVQHAILPYPDSPDRLASLTREASRSGRSRIDLEATQRPDDATPSVGW